MASTEHHLKGRRNAAKPENEKASAFIHMRCHPDDKARIVRNLRKGETLASFVMGLAIAECDAREKGRE